jgi:photosystem II stability/assembly factor-like uncharacterized protein
MGSVMSFSGQPVYGHHFYAASQRGLFVSRDSGQKWTRLNTPWPEAGGTFVLAPDDGRVFYGTTKGLTVSTDEGSHWRTVEMEDGPTPVRCIRVVPHKPQIVLMSTGSGLYRSEDGGARWSRPHGGLPRSETFDIQFDERHGTEIYVTESYFGALYRSTDMGVTWDWMSPFPGAGLKCRSVFADPQTPDRFYVLFFREGLYTFDGSRSQDSKEISTTHTPSNNHVQSP